jgi:hypothetical protein
MRVSSIACGYRRERKKKGAEGRLVRKGQLPIRCWQRDIRARATSEQSFDMALVKVLVPVEQRRGVGLFKAEGANRPRGSRMTLG